MRNFITSTLLLSAAASPALAFVPPSLRLVRTAWNIKTTSSSCSSSSARRSSCRNPLLYAKNSSEEETPTAVFFDPLDEKRKRRETSLPSLSDDSDDDTELWLEYQQATQLQHEVDHHPYNNNNDDDQQQLLSSSPPPFVLSQLWKARFLLLGAAALYGTNFSVIKILDDTLPVGIAATLRFGIASLCTLPWLLAPPKQPKSKDGTTTSVAISNTLESNWWDSNTMGAIATGLEVGLWNSIGYISQAVGLQTIDASKSAFLCSLAVVIVPLIEVASGKRLFPRQLIGAAMAVVGVGFLELGGDTTNLALSQGDIASLLQPFAFGVAFWRMERAMRLYPNEANRSTAAQLFAVFLASGVYCAITEGVHLDMAQIQTWLMTPSILGALFWTGTITTALTVYMEAVALKTLSAAETTVLLSAEPLFGALFASLLIGETFGIDAGIGAALIVAGCIFSNLGLAGILGKKGKDEENDSGATALKSLTLQQQQQQHDDTTTASSAEESTDKSSLLMKASLASAAAGSFLAATAQSAAAKATEDVELLGETIRNTLDSL